MRNFYKIMQSFTRKEKTAKTKTEFLRSLNVFMKMFPKISLSLLRRKSTVPLYYTFSDNRSARRDFP